MENIIGSLTGKWSWPDYFGAIRVRLGIKRDRYRINPGLYKIGHPDDKSHVLVTANYKLTVDILRKEVEKLNAWILVLDTKGVNVWCSAGKGTFGTEELIDKIIQFELSELVSHKSIIVPQLGAPGIAAAIVKKRTGFSVNYGPVEASDIYAYLDAGKEASAEMRKKNYSIKERFYVALTHFSQGLTASILITAGFFLLDMLFHNSPDFQIKLSLLLNFIISLGALLTGTILANIFLPALPGKAFSVKGLIIGLIYSIPVFVYLTKFSQEQSLYYIGAKVLLLLTFIVYQVLNLTGSSTYTSLSGVQKEMTITIPVLIASLLVGIVLLILGGLVI